MSDHKDKAGETDDFRPETQPGDPDNLEIDPSAAGNKPGGMIGEADRTDGGREETQQAAPEEGMTAAIGSSDAEIRRAFIADREREEQVLRAKPGEQTGRDRTLQGNKPGIGTAAIGSEAGGDLMDETGQGQGQSKGRSQTQPQE